MKGLLIKEFYSVKTLAKQYLVVIVAMGVWCGFVKNPSFFPMIMSMYGAMTILTSMSYDEMVHFDKFEMTLPLSRSQVVISRYLLLGILVLIGGAVGMAGDFLIRTAVSGIKGDLWEDFISSCAVVAFFLLAFSILLPITFKMGVEKARMVLVVIYFLLFGGLYVAASFLGGLDGEQVGVFIMTGGSPALFIAGTLVFAAAVMFVSCMISVGIMKKREW